MHTKNTTRHGICTPKTVAWYAHARVHLLAPYTANRENVYSAPYKEGSVQNDRLALLVIRMGAATLRHGGMRLHDEKA